MSRKSRRVHKNGRDSFPITKLVPNFITFCALCSGMMALRYSIDLRFEIAVTFMVAAAIFDALDGRLARILNAQSKMGSELDSLCDFANFGIFSSIILYIWGLMEDGIIGWFAVMLFILCTCVRLARFNVISNSHIADETLSRFFVGVPSTIGGLLALLPIVFSVDIIDIRSIVPEYYLSIYTIIVALLMVSRIPTISSKKIKIPHSLARYVMLLLGFLIILIFILTWKVFIALSLAYFISIPLSWYRFRKLMSQKVELT
jgi:CDP-diacylglycerol--serine O-phosphatidyltransferase